MTTGILETYRRYPKRGAPTLIEGFIDTVGTPGTGAVVILANDLFDDLEMPSDELRPPNPGRPTKLPKTSIS